MKQLGHLKPYKMKLTTLSPVFIGDGEAVKGIENEEDFKNKVLKNDSNLMEQWIDYFINFQDYQMKKLVPRDAKKPSLQGFLRLKNNDKGKKNNDFISTSGRYYIPGSSIKGAIKTALLSAKIKEIKQKRGITDTKEILKEAEKNLKVQMRYIAVSDSEEISKEDIDLMNIKPQKIIHNKSVGYSKTSGISKLKLLYDRVDVYFYITIDTKRSDYTIDKILELLKEHYTEVYNENKKALEENPQKVSVCADDLKLEPNINIGGQSGFNTKVVLRALSKNDEEYIKLKKVKLARKFKYHSHDNSEIPTAPRYLKFAESYYNNKVEKLTLGWCSIDKAK